MPTYAYRCETCKSDQDAFSSIADRDANAPECCGAKMQRILTAPNLQIQTEARYRCPMTREIVTTRRRRQYLMDKNNVVDANDYASNFEKTKKRAQADRDLAAELHKGEPAEVMREAQRILQQATPGA